MAAPCTEHLFLTGEKGVGKSTLARHLLAGHTPCGFRTVRVTGVMDRPSVHLLPAVGGEATADNLLFYCGEYDPSRFDTLGTAALDGDMPVLGVLQKADTAFLRAVASHPRVRVVTVTEENRDRLRQELHL